MPSGWDNAVWAPPVDPKALPSTPSAEDMQIVYAELAKQQAAEGTTFMDAAEMCGLFGATDWDDDVMRNVRGMWHEGTPHAFPRVQTRLVQARRDHRTGVQNDKVTTAMVAVCLRREVNQWLTYFRPVAEAFMRQTHERPGPLGRLIGKK